MLKKITAIIILIASAIALFIFSQREKSVVANYVNKPEKKQNTNRLSLKEARYEKLNTSTEEITVFPKSCFETLQLISKTTSDDLFNQLSTIDSVEDFFNPECLSNLKTNNLFLKLTKSFQCDFLSKGFNLKEKNLKEKCAGFFMVLKAFTISDFAKNTPLNKLTGEELAAMFVKIFFSIDELTKDQFIKNNELIDTFYEMYPNDPNVIEAAIGYLMIGQMVTQYQGLAEKIEERFEKHKGESFKVDRLSIINHIAQSNLKKAKSTLDELNTHYPKEADLQYYYAAYYWEKKDRASTITYLNKAIELSKNETSGTPSLYKETKEKIKTATIGDKKLFSMSIGLNFENL